MRSFLVAQGGSDFAGDVIDVAEIEFTAAQAGRAHANEGDFRFFDRLMWIGGGMQPAGVVAFHHHLAHAGFDDGTAARLEHFDFRAANVDANDAMAHGSKASGGDRTDVTETEDADRTTHA